jgi:hypothetical protein
MSATQVNLNLYNHSNILSAITGLIEESGTWRGQASELSKKLELEISPRILSVQLKNLKDEFENHGILIRWGRSHGRNMIAIEKSGDTHRMQQNLIKHIHPPSYTSKHDDFATPLQKETITFPFEWKYGRITELSKREKEEVNKVKHQSRKQYKKPCSLCGEEGILEYRKVSDGNSSLICKLCAEKYVRNAKRIILQNGDIGMM